MGPSRAVRRPGRRFDHHSVSVTPKENAELLAGLVPGRSPRSRSTWSPRAGRLVGARDRVGRRLDVRGLVMVASPNAGTVLADREHLSDLLDRITDLAQFVPDNGVTDTLGLVFAVVKQLAVGAVGGLDGPDVDEPRRGVPRELNGRPALAAVVRAIAADYEPPQGRRSPGSPATRAPTWCSVSRQRPRRPDRRLLVRRRRRSFPIDERLVLDASRSVDHNSFFRQPEVAEQLLEWLPTGARLRSEPWRGRRLSPNSRSGGAPGHLEEGLAGLAVLGELLGLASLPEACAPWARSASILAMASSSLVTMSSARADFSGSVRRHCSSSTARMACSTLRMRPSRSRIRSRGPCQRRPSGRRCRGTAVLAASRSVTGTSASASTSSFSLTSAFAANSAS